jgi:PAS domain S-box-containing protein
MQTHPASSFFKSSSRGISLFVIMIGCLVLVGWALDNAVLKSIVPGLVSMKSNTALLFVLCGISLWIQNDRPEQPAAQALAVVIALGEIVTLAEYAFNQDLGIDQIIFRDDSLGVLHPGRMAPATALAFFLVGLALIFLDRGSRGRLQEMMSIIVFAISGLALIGYLYGVSSLYKIGAYSSMAVHTALSHLLLSLGILFARPQHNLMRTLMADTAGGNILRRFLPTAIAVPVLLGWIRLWGQQAGLYDTAFGVALLVISLITTLTIFIWANARQITEIDLKRKSINDNLQESELRFRSTLESMIEGCQIIGFDWRYLYLNDSAVKHSQQTRESLVGRTMMECYPGIEETAVFHTLQRCMTERTSHHMVNEFIFPDGSRGWFELSVQPAPDGIFILSSDITRHKQAEQALLEREMKLTILFEILPVGISILDPEGKVSYTNTALKTMLNISERDLLDGAYRNRRYLRADGSLMPPEELASAQALKENREIHGVETGVVTENGSVVWTNVSAVPVDLPDWKLVIVTSDITERKQAEKNLLSNERRLHLAASAGEVGIWDWDIVNDQLIWDDTMYSLYRIDRDDFNGAYHAWSSTLHPDDRQFTEGEIQAALRGEREYAPEFRVVRPDGTVRVMKATSQTIRDQDGRPLRMIGTNIDITERKQTENELLKLNTELEAKVVQRTA